LANQQLGIAGYGDVELVVCHCVNKQRRADGGMVVAQVEVLLALYTRRILAPMRLSKEVSFVIDEASSCTPGVVVAAVSLLAGIYSPSFKDK
jgi:hypothetical protein